MKSKKRILCKYNMLFTTHECESNVNNHLENIQNINALVLMKIVLKIKFALM